TLVFFFQLCLQTRSDPAYNVRLCIDVPKVMRSAEPGQLLLLFGVKRLCVVPVHELRVDIYPRRRPPPRHALVAKFVIFTAAVYPALASSVKSCNHALCATRHEPAKVLPRLHPANKRHVYRLGQALNQCRQSLGFQRLNWQLLPPSLYRSCGKRNTSRQRTGICSGHGGQVGCVLETADKLYTRPAIPESQKAWLTFSFPNPYISNALRNPLHGYITAFGKTQLC